MNERIFEIIQYINGRVGLQWDDEDKEELAELIVKECATFIDSTFDIDEHSGEVVSWADGDKLKEHFGVEE